MDALQILRDDHRRIKDVFRRFDEAKDNRTRKDVIEAAIAELVNHTETEEEIFYPAMQRLGMGDLVDRAEAEHEAAEQAISELQVMSANDGQLEAKFRVLVEIVTHHMTEEESQIFPRAAEEGYEKLELIGDEIQEMRRELAGTTVTRPGTPRKASGKHRQRRTATNNGKIRARKTGGRTTRARGAGNGRRKLETLTRDQLYERAQKAEIPGRSQMNKRELARALGAGR
jgi:hemerythrin superfamily protein